MKLILTCILALLFSRAHAQDGDPFTNGTAEDIAPSNLFEIVPDPEGNAYFPKGRAAWYTDHLRAMNEPSLLSMKDHGRHDQFRFLYLPTFSKPIVFRTVQKEGKFFIRTKRLDGKGGYDPGELELDADIQISRREYEALRKLIRNQFESLKNSSEEAEALSGLDGSQWILEAIIEGEYHFRDIWSPKSLPNVSKEKFKEQMGFDMPDFRPFVTACEFFLYLTDFKFPERDAELEDE